MSDSIRERILQTVAARVATITGQGFSVDLRREVYRARRSFTVDELPAAAVWDGDETATDGYGSTEQTMDVAIEIHCACDSDPSPLAQGLIADGRKAMETYDSALAALTSRIGYAGGGPTYPADGESIVSVRLRYKITYSTVRGDPYTQP